MSEAHDALAGVDLNLLRALDALLAERHVTRAARRLGVTQSAASHALGKLRDLVGDPLLVRGTGGALIPTARAIELGPPLQKALAALGDALRGRAAFDPATSRRAFHIGTSDFVETVLLPDLAARVQREAPFIDLWFHTYLDWGDEELASGALDLAIGPVRRGARPAGMYEKLLFDERFTCVVRKGHPLAGGRMTLNRYCAASHLMVAPRGTPGSFVDDALGAIGRTRRVAVAVPHFLVVPRVIAATDLVATLASRIADLFAPILHAMPPPLALPPFQMTASWHARDHADPAHKWLRDQVSAAAQIVA